MANIRLDDVTVHIDESLDQEARNRLVSHLRSLDGVVSVEGSETTPHLFIVRFDESHITTKNILKVILGENLHAELLG